MEVGMRRIKKRIMKKEQTRRKKGNDDKSRFCLRYTKVRLFRTLQFYIASYA
jgi:hypothetical protein